MLQFSPNRGLACCLICDILVWPFCHNPPREREAGRNHRPKGMFLECFTPNGLKPDFLPQRIGFFFFWQEEKNPVPARLFYIFFFGNKCVIFREITFHLADIALNKFGLFIVFLIGKFTGGIHIQAGHNRDLFQHKAMGKPPPAPQNKSIQETLLFIPHP